MNPFPLSYSALFQYATTRETRWSRTRNYPNPLQFFWIQANVLKRQIVNLICYPRCHSFFLKIKKSCCFVLFIWLLSLYPLFSFFLSCLHIHRPHAMLVGTRPIRFGRSQLQGQTQNEITNRGMRDSSESLLLRKHGKGGKGRRSHFLLCSSSGEKCRFNNSTDI